ncbi:MAG: stage II sporulation protein M [Nanoarchaeota archaeon]
MEIKKRYFESWNYIVESRKYIYFIISIFFIAGVFGFIFHSNLDFLISTLKQMVERTKGLSLFELFVWIFVNNLRAALFGMLGGLVLGILPILNALSNGVILGYVFQMVGVKAGYLEFWKILPHGIFELPAVFISLGIGVRLGMFVFTKNKKEVFVYETRQAILTFILIVVPLLVLAAIIESLLIWLKI